MPSLFKTFAASLRRLRRDKSAVTAVEFAIVGLPFFALIFVLVEVSLTAFIQANIDDAAIELARSVGQGKVQGRIVPASQFKTTYVCPKLPGFISCSLVEVIIVPIPATPTGSRDLMGPFGIPVAVGSSICPGAAGDYVFIQVSYAMPKISRFLPGDGASDASGNRLLTSGVAIKNEPYTGGVVSGCLS
ncbi:MAG: TadE-like protein [Hyphomicrobiales bacterium]|nr:TadE-like protein [Hyphomicrobiales bacterium]